MRRTIWALLAVLLFLCCFSRQEKNESNTGDAAELWTGRAVSLRVLQEKLKSSPLDEELRDDIAGLCGMTRLMGYVIDRTEQDIILVGQSDSSLPPMHLDDFVVALRNAWKVYAERKGDTQYYSDPGCSIDPDSNVLLRLDKLGDRIERSSKVAQVKGLLQEWRDLCREPQQVRVMGVPFDSRFGQVMVEADYEMKTIVDGSDSTLAIEGFKSLADMVLDSVRAAVSQKRSTTVPLSMMNRFWFCAGENRYATDDLGALIRECSVRLLTEEEHVQKSTGRSIGTGRAHPMALAFSQAYSNRYGAIAKQRPIYAELENLYRFVAVAKLMRRYDASATAGLDLGYLLNHHQVAKPHVDRSLPGRSNVDTFASREDFAGGHREMHFWLPSCGGVIIDVPPRETKYEEGTEIEREFEDLWQRIFKERGGKLKLKWNFHLEDKTELERWELLKTMYAVLQRDRVRTSADWGHAQWPVYRLTRGSEL